MATFSMVINKRIRILRNIIANDWVTDNQYTAAHVAKQGSRMKRVLKPGRQNKNVKQNLARLRVLMRENPAMSRRPVFKSC